MDHVELTRDCEAIRVPAGDRITLPQGTEAFIAQALGGSFTLQVRSHGGLFRIAGRDADAIGREVPEEAKIPDGSAAGADIEERVWSALKTCYDPEIPVNIVELGLVYDLRVHPEADGTHRIAVQMTLTAQGCGMGAAIAADAEDKIRALDGVIDATVGIVWDPPWNPRMMSAEAREKLGI